MNEVIRHIIGTWKLISFNGISHTGELYEGPLGNSPKGYLIYTEEGIVSVNMARIPPVSKNDNCKIPYMSYAGSWSYEGNNNILHRITIAENSEWIGTEQRRTIELEGEQLIIYGNALRDKLDQRVLTWHKIYTSHT